jgi:2-polyprenyl-3-methyl-5-hydroxy-6-metoxy-1,4-benzoquinol methylase
MKILPRTYSRIPKTKELTRLFMISKARNDSPKLKKIVSSYKNYYKSYSCIACGSSVKKNAVIFANVYHDNYLGKSTVLECKMCGIGYTYPFLSKRELSRLYVNYEANVWNPATKAYVNILLAIMNKIETIFLEKSLKLKHSLLKRIITSFLTPYLFQAFPLYTYKKSARKLKILDFGCGEGSFLLQAKKAGCNVYGVEVNQCMVKKLKKKGIHATVNLKDFVASNTKFDVIRADQAFEHIKDPNEILPIFRKLLRKDGELIIGVPNFNTLAKITKQYFFLHVPYHRLQYTKKSMELILNKNKYKMSYFKTKSRGVLSFSLLSRFGKRSSLLTNPIKFIEIFLLSTPLDILKIGDCMEIYAKKGS